MSKPIAYYYDLLSQPSRAMYIILKLNNIPFEDQPVALRKGAHLTQEYKQNVNRFQKVPCIVDNGFKLSESIAILRYLDNQKLLLDKWYPSDIKKRAAIDEYLEWQHHNTRLTCSMYFRMKWIEPLVLGKQPDPKKLESTKKHMENILDMIENIWLDKTKFLAGNEITVADIFGACEIEQPRMAGYNPCINRPKLEAWLNLVRNTTNPVYGEAHKFVNKFVDSNVLEKKAKL